MIRQDFSDRAFDLCYDAIFSDDLWPQALDSLATAFGAQACSFVSRGSSDLRRRLPASSAYQEFLVDFIGEGWAEQDHRARRGWPRLAGGGVVLTEEDVSTEDERATLPVYRDLYARHDLPWWSTVSFAVSDDLWALSFLRSRDAGPFQKSEIPGLISLAPNLSRLVSLKSKLLAARAHDAVGLLESTIQAAIVVDDSGKVVATNALAERLLGEDLKIVCGRLRATSSQFDSKLQLLIQKAVRLRSSQLPQPVVVERNDRPPIFIDAANDARLFDRYFRGQAVLLLTDIGSLGVPREDWLRSAFQLTRAETSLALILSSGRSLDEAASMLGVAKETSRSQLKMIFQKTGTNRQTKLARVLQSLARVAP